MPSANIAPLGIRPAARFAIWPLAKAHEMCRRHGRIGKGMASAVVSGILIKRMACAQTRATYITTRGGDTMGENGNTGRKVSKLELKRIARMEELLKVERTWWDKGLTVAGMDEVGRGPLAGPVVTACIMIPQGSEVPGADDSKRLTERRREQLAPLLMSAASFVGIGSASPERIDEINILNATREAMNEAARGCDCDVLLVDAVEGLDCPCRIESLIHGDATSYMIAAASIVAKVYRDHIMIEMDEKYPQYGFARNKGYGTAEHIAALEKYGPCPIHRRSFIAKWL